MTTRTGSHHIQTTLRVRLAHWIREITAGLEALHRVQFAEPWRTQRRRQLYGEW